MASVARLGYQIPEANKPNQTIIVMILSELKYATPLTLQSLAFQSHANKATRYSITEHMIGLIVSSMPSFPAFVRHLRGIAPATSISFEPWNQRGNRKTSEKSLLWLKRSLNPDRGTLGTGVGLDDPSLLHSANNGHGDARYEELTDLEGQKGMQTKREGLEGFMDNRTTTDFGTANRVR